MKRVTLYCLLFCLISLPSSFALAKHQTHQHSKAIIGVISPTLAAHQKLPPPDGTPVLVQEKLIPLLQRTDVSSKAALLTAAIPVYTAILKRPAEIPVNQFEQGLYLRYRPRDPPIL